MTQQAPIFLNMKAYPKCDHCGKRFTPGSSWKGANHCRFAYLLPFITAHPGLSSAELAELSHIPYFLVKNALQMARDAGLVEAVAEEREIGGMRYRYRSVTRDGESSS